MKFRARFLYVIPVVFVLAACTSTQAEQQSLSQQLEGKSPEEKQEILRLACLNEAEYSTNINKSKNTRLHGGRHKPRVKETEETKRLKTLCREMTDSYAATSKQ